MAFRTVTGYCWPQSIAAGGSVALHLSSPDAEPVAVEVARIGAERDVVWSDTVPADDHPTPNDASAHGCQWPVAAGITAETDWRSGYYEVLLTVEADGKT
ncbi:MAG: N,N-dimethylformamidase beta subunit family domain-containing protein, partial [Acidimicrobiales bacterium]